jgi:hypothetical protein
MGETMDESVDISMSITRLALTGLQMALSIPLATVVRNPSVVWIGFEM